ncbi:hypothetical protein MUY27_05150 [Mucilaginibacter sp. RS28]|uniref:PH domain-containing protein n=1 Tax=Mucilaginibacter straminoryzae TaxID=2932774 RepID=A0A9X2B847_9SPHI|nr:hypothetical protein [Mucilaginibacter straminoryzae]MCJ8209086.1 hypothetical protein [Mucilaginibacter straminoryzae]
MAVNTYFRIEMLKLISKVQHKNYEKGEFSDEQSRSLEETLELIKKFPWEQERSLTDIQLTGPGVVIQNNAGEYLKVGLYFNGKFALYYLDQNGRLFDHPVVTLTEVCERIASFFKGGLDLIVFKKNTNSLFPRTHFITKSFEYRGTLSSFFINSWGLMAVEIIIILVMWYLLINERYTDAFVVSFILVMLSATLIYFVYGAYKAKKMYLRLSKGNEEFSFGYDINNVKNYSKELIANVEFYSRQKKSFFRNGIPLTTAKAFKINFKNGEYIRFSSFLISGNQLRKKFKTELIKECNEELWGML